MGLFHVHLPATLYCFTSCTRLIDHVMKVTWPRVRYTGLGDQEATCTWLKSQLMQLASPHPLPHSRHLPTLRVARREMDEREGREIERELLLLGF